MKRYEKLMLVKNEAIMLAEIMPDEILKQFVTLHYGEELPLEKVAEKMNYSAREVQRFNQEVKNYALKYFLSKEVKANDQSKTTNNP